MKDLHLLPKVRDSLSYLYVEHCKIDQDVKAIAMHNAHGKTPIPCAALTLLMLGPGTSITHAAVRVLAESGCLVVWSGEEGVRLYAQGLGETRSAVRLLHQAALASSPRRRMEVVVRMYRMRFPEELDPSLTLQQIRGREGIRVREGYARMSRETGVAWGGRRYDRKDWAGADPVNRALSAANACLYGVVHAAVVSAGYSPAIGFIHTGKMLSFVYDIADLYKVDMTIPVAFSAVAEGTSDLDARVRRTCRDMFHQERLLQRIVPDMDSALSVQAPGESDFDADDALPGGLWDPQAGIVAGGLNRADVTAGG